MGQTYQSIVINAPLENVWKAIRNFHDMGWAPNVITSVDVIGAKKGNQVGAKRVLNNAFHETLLDLNEDEHTFSYQIEDGPSPVAKDDVDDYIGQVSVRPITEGGGTFVEWSSKWKRNESATGEFVHAIYVALLADMKKSLGQ